MQALIQQFIQHAIIQGYHVKRIHGIDVVGFTENLSNVEEVKFCASSSGLITNMDEVMTSFRVMLGEPTSSEFFINIGKHYPLGLINVGKIVNLKNTLGTCVLLNGTPKDNWEIINQLKDIIGEPKKGIWDVSLSYSWYISLG